MNNYFIIGKVNEGKSHLFNLFSKTHKTISNPKANTTIDVIRKNISSENFEYNIYDTPGFYKLSDFTDLLNKISTLKLENIKFIYLISSFTNEDLKICKQLYSKKYNLLLFSFKKIDDKDYISNLFDKTFTNNSDNFSSLKKYLSNNNKKQISNVKNVNKKTIAIFGKENTGKSTLFNRLTKTRDALVAGVPGLTRDRQFGKAQLDGRSFWLIDTGGLSGEEQGIDEHMAAQSLTAIDEADLIFFLVDVKDGRLPQDDDIAKLLRNKNKPIQLVANKIDGQKKHSIKKANTKRYNH